MRNYMVITVILLIAGSLYSQDEAGVCINEFLASNRSVDADIVDFDDYSDWIELYNGAASEIDLGGYFLSDDPGDPDKWEIPPGTVIGGQGFLRFWADGYDAPPGMTFYRSWLGPEAERLYFTTDYHHLNFKLSRAGEFIGLFSPSGEIVDTISFGLQYRDVSMGRQPDGSPHWMYFGEPTPLAANQTPGFQSVSFAGQTDLAPGSGFYQAPVAVQGTVAEGGADIRYTLDGSKPAGTSPLLEDPASFPETGIMRARAYQSGMIPGEITHGTWFIGESHSLPVISIIADPDALWDDLYGIYENRMKSREIPVHFQYFDSDGMPALHMDAGLRLSGQASLYYPQVSFTLYARDRYGADAFSYQLFPQRDQFEHKSLYLRNAGVPDHRSTFFRDALQHSLVLGKMDLDCQAYQPAVVYLNGEYWGIYNIRDKINADYLSSLHLADPENIDLIEYETGSSLPVVMEGNSDDYKLFFNWIRDHDLSVEENYTFLESRMDMGEFINYQICEIFCDNMFWPDQNVRVWRERKEGAKWRWILFDTDFGFGMPSNRSTGYTNNTLAYASGEKETGFQAPEWSTMIFSKLLKNDAFREEFIRRFDAYLNTVFHSDTVLSLISNMKGALDPEMGRHISRWRNGEAYYGMPISGKSEWQENIRVMERFAENRPWVQRQQLEYQFELEGSTELRVEIDPPGSGQVLINGIVPASGGMAGTYFRGIPVTLGAIPEVGFRFTGWTGTEADSSGMARVFLEGDSASITAIFAPEQISILPSRIGQDTVLSAENSPYYATGDMVVDSGTMLVIEEGVEIFMPEQANILVYGRLDIAGTSENPVVIAPNEYAGSWGALCFIQSGDSSQISHLIITGASRGSDFSRDRAAVSGYHSAFTLKGVSVKQSGMPVFVQGGKVSISGCSLRAGQAGDLINVKRAEQVLVEDCDLRGNDFFDSDAIDLDEVSNGIIRGNRIYNFYGVNSDGIDLGEAATGIMIEENIIYNIRDKGVSIGGGSTALLRRNLIANCGQGVGIKDSGSHGRIEHNTFYANQYGIASFEKNIGAGGGKADVVNCILADSRESSVFVDARSTANISYCLINTDDPGGLHNILAEALLANNLHLATGSPAINSGNPSLTPDPDGSLPDMGAFPYDEDYIDLRINEIYYHPAGGSDMEFIEIWNAGEEVVNMNGMQMGGDIRLVFGEGTLDPGELLLLARDLSAYKGIGCQVLQWEEGELSKGPGSVHLLDASGVLLDFVHYDSRFDWPAEADGQGPSLELHDPGLENMVSCNWRSSYSAGGTPGEASNSVLISGIYINEFLANNHHLNTDEFGEFDDWIEIHNSSDLAVNIGGLYLTDDLTDPFRHQVPFHDARETTLSPGGFLLLWADGDPAQGITHLNFRLNQAGEAIGLVQKVDGEAVFLDSLSFGGQSMDISSGRYADGSGLWYTMIDPTPGVPNILSTDHRSVIADGDHLQLFAYPNPFSGHNTILYTLPEPADVALGIYDMAGRKVAMLVSGRKAAGTHQIRWNAAGLDPGIYFCTLQTGKSRRVIKMVLTHCP